MLERPVTGGAPKKPRERADVVATLPVAAITAALWAAGVGLVVIGVLTSVAWAVSSRGADGISTPLRASGTSKPWIGSRVTSVALTSRS